MRRTAELYPDAVRAHIPYIMDVWDANLICNVMDKIGSWLYFVWDGDRDIDWDMLLKKSRCR